MSATMQAQALYDLSPLWRVMLLGAVVALLPLLWVWKRNHSSTRRLQALTVLTLFLSFDLVLFGAFTRLTDSGLGCPDWPGCYGQSSPLEARTQIAVAQTAMPTGPVTHGKAWIEMLHRYLATAVGVLIIALTVWHWRRRSGTPFDEVISPWWATTTLIWVCVQGAFGMLTVTMKLFPAIVTLHLLGGMVLLGLLTVQATRLSQHSERTQTLTGGLRGFVWIVLTLVALQVALGGWVSTNYAVLACSEFPQCQGAWWPLMDFANGFSVWRELGMTADGKFLGFEALTAIHFTHRIFAVAVLAALTGLGWRMRRVATLRPQSHWLLGLTLAQLLTGLSNVVLGWPLVAAVLHTGGAAALVVVLVWTLCASGSTQWARR
jgi:cytochrome c oxidase assembly protein subunit 15